MGDAVIAVGKRVRVVRPRSKHDGKHGRVTGVGVDDYKRAENGDFLWTVVVETQTMNGLDRFTVPLSYVQIATGAEWTPALDPDGQHAQEPPKKGSTTIP